MSRPGPIADAIVDFLRTRGQGGATLEEIYIEVKRRVRGVQESSIRGALNRNIPTAKPLKSGVKFERIGNSTYRIHREYQPK